MKTKTFTEAAGASTLARDKKTERELPPNLQKYPSYRTYPLFRSMNGSHNKNAVITRAPSLRTVDDELKESCAEEGSETGESTSEDKDKNSLTQNPPSARMQELRQERNG